MLNFREQELLKLFYQDPHFLAKYNEAVNTLTKLGVFEFLKERGRVQIIKKDMDLAVEAARSYGFNEALENIIFLKELFMDAFIKPENHPPDFGGLDAALRNDNLTPEEVNAIRTGTKPQYNTSGTFPKTINGAAVKQHS